MPGHGTGLYGEGSPALQGEWAELMGTLASSFPDLLVKSRVISQQADERSYYVFHHILTGSLSLSVKIFTSLSLSLNRFQLSPVMKESPVCGGALWSHTNLFS